MIKGPLNVCLMTVLCTFHLLLTLICCMTITDQSVYMYFNVKFICSCDFRCHCHNCILSKQP
jgi:hypothetical protein